MNTNERIGRLQQLLERVQARALVTGPSPAVQAGVPASTRHAYAAPPEVVAAVPYVDEYSAESPDTPTQSRAVDSLRVPAAPETATGYDDSDVEVSSEVVEVEIDDEPEGLPMESGAQLVSAAPAPLDELEEVHEASDGDTIPPEAPEAEDHLVAAPANELEEPAPSSSRRPRAGEEPIHEAYEAESAPRHTPPPESGKQVALSPSSPPPPSQKPSAPPASLEGHTLIGGWREPGLGAPSLMSPVLPTGMRVPAPPPAVAQPSGTRLSPEVTAPSLPSGQGVAAFTGAAPIARPKTLGELLDLTLSL